MWKFVGDSTLSEAIKTGDMSYIQNAVYQFTIQAKYSKFQPNERKCKELRTVFVLIGVRHNPSLF